MRSPGTHPRLRLAAGVATLVVLALAAFVRPIVSPQQDAPMYLAAAHGYLTEGLAHLYGREPAFPLFLAMLERGGLSLDGSLALVQNALFMAGLYFFLGSVLPRQVRRATLWTAAALVALVPTFLVTVNGSMYTESISCTLIFLMLGSLARSYRRADDGATPGNPVWRSLAWGGVAALASGMLALTKGSFLYVNVAFGVAGAIAAAFGRLKRPQSLALATSFLAVAMLAWGGTEAWLSSRTPPQRGFDRRGWVLYGRVEYAGRFDFEKQSVPFLVNALSESACRRIYGGACDAYTFEAENAPGYAELARTHGDEQALFESGIKEVFRQPGRQLVFAFFELARFVLHHGTTGFAKLHVPLLGAFFASGAMAALLKLFNLALYLVPPVTAIALRRRGRPLTAIWKAWHDETRFGIGLAVAYACLYLALHGFATTAVRMVYPIAPFLLLFDMQVVWTARSLLRTSTDRR